MHEQCTGHTDKHSKKWNGKRKSFVKERQEGKKRDEVEEEGKREWLGEKRKSVAKTEMDREEGIRQ